MQAGFDGAQIRVDDAGDFFKRHFFIFHQNQHFALQYRQSFDCHSDAICAFAFQQDFERTGIAAWCIDVVQETLAAQIAEPLSRKISHGGVEVSSQGALSLVESASKQAEEAIVNQILGGRGRAGESVRETEQRIAVLVVNRRSWCSSGIASLVYYHETRKGFVWPCS